MTAKKKPTNPVATQSAAQRQAAVKKVESIFKKTADEMQKTLWEKFGEERGLVQTLMFDLMNDGTKNYHAAIDGLLALKEVTHKTNPDDMTKLGRAVEWTLIRVECELFGDFLDD